MRKNRRRKNNKKKKILLGLVLIIIAIITVLVIFPNGEIGIDLKRKLIKKEDTIKIFNLNSNKRPIAVMINNHSQARPYHSGLQDAQVVYELIVEGGITRMMAVFKDKTTSRIGPIRSSRHNYLDYALEHDAIYAHWGWSPQAESDISSLGVNNLNGLYDSGFTRDQNLVGRINLEHTAITSMDGLNKAIKSKGYRTTYESNDVKNELVFNYSAKEINLQPKKDTNTKDTGTNSAKTVESDAIVANNVKVPYSNYMVASYVYSPDNKYYLRYANGVEHKDYITGEQYHFKNIIIQKVENYSMDSYGRQDLKTVGSGTGYFITNGYARPITWEKSSRSSKTVYKYADGKEIVLNDGNTFVQIEPAIMNPSITG